MRGWIILGLLLASSAGARAEEAPMPVLGAHRFVPATRLEDPFVNGYLQTSVALGSATNTSTPTYILPDSTVVQTAPAEQFYFGLGFTYQHRMKDWLGVLVDLHAAGRLGSNTRSLVADGITGNVNYHLGWKIRAIETRSFLASGSIGLTNRATSLINILRWADDLIAGKDADLVLSKRSLRGRLGIHTAWGINRRFGLLASAVADYGEPLDGHQSNTWQGEAKLGLSYDLESDLGVPLGLAATLGYSGVDVLDTSSVWFWRTRLAFQSRADFSIGLDFGTSYFESLERNADTQFSEFSLDTRYYF